jgi:hypothetical protein
MTRTEHLLVIAMEECNEVSQRLLKALRFGLHEIQDDAAQGTLDNPDGLNNVERIRHEFSQLCAVLEMLAPPSPTGGQIYPPLGRVMDEKRAKVEKYLRYSAECGTLETGEIPHP